MSQDIGDMPADAHAALVDRILTSLERNLGIRITGWERVDGKDTTQA